MPSQFPQSLSLSSLLAPVSIEEFQNTYFDRKPLIVARNDRTYYGDLFTLDEFDEAASRNPERVKLFDAAKNEVIDFKGRSVADLEAIVTGLQKGGTLILYRFEERNAKLGLLCRQLGVASGHRFIADLYLAPTGAEGFRPRWDNRDQFVLQLAGTRRWRIETDRRINPGRADQIDEESRQLRGEVTEITLAEGDLAYIPRGYVFASSPSHEESSLHLTLRWDMAFLEELLDASIKAAVQRDQRLSATLPLGFMQVSGRGLVDRAAAALRAAANEDFLRGVVQQYRDELVGLFPLDISGLIRDSFAPEPLSLDDFCSPRPGTVFRLHAEDGPVRLLVGTRNIEFNDLFRDGVKFALDQARFSIRDIPGDIEDEERLALVERLIQEGVVIRHSDHG